jgi:hypothetical protein
MTTEKEPRLIGMHIIGMIVVDGQPQETGFDMGCAYTESFQEADRVIPELLRRIADTWTFASMTENLDLEDQG